MFTLGNALSLKDDSSPNSGGKAYFKEPGTATAKTTYTTSALSVDNANPVVFDSAGRASIYFEGDADVYIYDSNDVLLFSQPNVNPTTNATITALSSNTTLAAAHNTNTIEASGTTTLTLTAAATLGAGWYVRIKNAGVGVVTIARANSGDSIDGVSSSFYLNPGYSLIVQVNAAETGFITSGSLHGLLTATGDIVYAEAANKPKRLAIGTAGQVLSVSAAGTGFAYWAPRGYIAGLTLSNNGADATNDIDIAVGECTDSTNAYVLKLTSALTKQLDAAWAVGSAAGGLDTGAKANSTWYHVYIIRKDSDGSIDALFSTSASAPTMPAGYTYKRLIGSVRTDSGGAILAFLSYETAGGGVHVLWSSPTLDIDLANTLTTARRSDALKVPTGYSVEAQVGVRIYDATAAARVYMSCPDTTDLAPSSTATPLATVTSTTAYDQGALLDIRTNTSAQISARADLATVDVYKVVTIGWRWGRR